MGAEVIVGIVGTVVTAVVGLGIASYIEMARISREDRQQQRSVIAEAHEAIAGIEAEFAERVTAGR
ncbi:MAG: hypothetical protein O3A10_15945 [Chloroflexi bacterium]|nr:hypothetical protein [Chloroflexota bacterium]MDA1148256.1 hypothetical protein [Chloroflexota bacterium]